MKIYQVGGAVRDALLGEAVKDSDWVVVGATPEQLTARGFRPVGRDFPVFLHPESGEEYALARTERKTAPGYRGFAVHASPEVTLEQDLERRDLTINAIARAGDGSLVDPFGGRADLEARLLRHVSDAFVEDPVRLLRVARFAARFAALGFTVAPQTLALMRRMTEAGEVDALVAERVWRETETALGTAQPDVYFEVLRACGALARVFPEVDALFGVPQPARWHPEIDTGVHTLMVLRQAARLSGCDALVAFAALTHDLGKGTTPREQWPGHRGHEQRSVELLRGLCARYKVPNDYRDLAALVAEHHGVVHRLAEVRPDTALKLLEKTDAVRRPERFERFVLACEADARGRTGLEDRAYPQAGALRAARAAAAAVTTADLDLDGVSGPAIGQRLRDARRRAVAGVLRGAFRES